MRHEVHVGALGVLQDGFRRDIAPMVQFVRNGGKFTKDVLKKYDPSREPKLIALTQFEDGKLFIRDGFHRTASIYLGRPQALLHDGEFFIENMTYEMFNQFNFQVGYVTPFDPRVNVRKADFGQFKKQVLESYQQGEDTESLVLNNKHLYLAPRTDAHDSLASFLACF